MSEILVNIMSVIIFGSCAGIVMMILVAAIMDVVEGLDDDDDDDERHIPWS